MTAIAATIATDIAEFCCELNQKPNGPSNFDLARLDDMLEKVRIADEAAFLSFRGVYYSYLGEKEKSLRYHNLSIDARPDLREVYNNFAASLERFGEFGMAVETALRMMKVAGPAEEDIHHLLTNAYYARRDDVIAEWLPVYRKMAQKEHFIERLIKNDCPGQGKDIATSELTALSVDSGAFSGIFCEGEDEAWQHLR